MHSGQQVEIMIVHTIFVQWVDISHAAHESIVLLLLLSLSLFALVSYSVLSICYSATWLLSRQCAIKLSVSVRVVGHRFHWHIDCDYITIVRMLFTSKQFYLVNSGKEKEWHLLHIKLHRYSLSMLFRHHKVYLYPPFFPAEILL